MNEHESRESLNHGQNVSGFRPDVATSAVPITSLPISVFSDVAAATLNRRKFALDEHRADNSRLVTFIYHVL